MKLNRLNYELYTTLEQPHQLVEKIPSILHKKTYFFYFTPSLLQNTHISLFILQDFSIKYSLFINFLLFSLMVILF